MPSAQDMIAAAAEAREKSAVAAVRSLDLCTLLQVVYDVLMGLKKKSPFHWQIVIRAVHGLISKTRRTMNC